MAQISENESVNGAKKSAYRQGIYVFLVLAVLTIAEFFIAQVSGGRAVPLLLIALIKSALIVYYFMHIYRLWGEEKH